MVIYDKMKNPGVPIEDICVRQTMLGSSYMLQTNPSSDYKIPLYEEKAKRVVQFGRYVEEQAADNYPVSWSEWLSLSAKGSKSHSFQTSICFLGDKTLG